MAMLVAFLSTAASLNLPPAANLVWYWAVASQGGASLVVLQPAQPAPTTTDSLVLSRAGLSNSSLIVDTSSLLLDVDYQITVRITGPALATPLTAAHTISRDASAMPDVIFASAGPYLSAASTTIQTQVSSPCSSAPVPDLTFL